MLLQAYKPVIMPTHQPGCWVQVAAQLDTSCCQAGLSPAMIATTSHGLLLLCTSHVTQHKLVHVNVRQDNTSDRKKVHC